MVSQKTVGLMTLDFQALIPSMPFIAKGLIVVLQYAGLSVSLGFFFGSGIAIARSISSGFGSRLAGAYVSIFRGTPLLLQLSLTYFAIPQVFQYQISAFEAGILAFSMNSAAYVSEAIRGGIQSVDKGQFEAAASLGLSPWRTMIYIVLPQAYRNCLPSLVNEVIGIIKETSLLSVIMEMDLLRRANIVAAEKYIYFEPLLFIGLIYYAITYLLTLLANYFEKRFRIHD